MQVTRLLLGLLLMCLVPPETEGHRSQFVFPKALGNLLMHWISFTIFVSNCFYFFSLSFFIPPLAWRP